MKTLLNLLLVTGIFTCLVLFSSDAVKSAETQNVKAFSWSAFQEPNYGASMYYPTELFEKGSLVDGAYVFPSKNGKATLMLKTFLDPMRTGAAETVSKLKTGRGAHQIIEIKSGDMWFEMAGKNGADGLVFMKTVYSCKERIVSQFNLIYPKAEKELYEKVLVKMRKRFHAAIGAKTPVRECS